MQAILRATKRQTPWLLLTLLVVVGVLLPIVPLQIMAFREGGAGFAAAFDIRDLGRLAWNTVALGLGALVVSMLVGTTLALAVHHLPPRLKAVFSAAPLLPIFIPAVAHVIGMIFLFSPEAGYVNGFLRSLPAFEGLESGPINVYTAFWIIVYTGVNLASFVFLFCYSGLKELGDSYGLVARVNGAGGWRVLRTVTLPMLRPVLVYAAVVALLLSLGQFTGPLMLGGREGLGVITTRMFEVSNQYPVDFALLGALGTPLLLVAVFVVFFQRKAIGRTDRFVGQGQTSRERTPTSTPITVVSVVYIVAFVTISAVLPLLALVYVAISPFWSGTFTLDGLTTAHWAEVFSNKQVQRAVFTSLEVTFWAIVVVVPLGLMVALALTNKDRLWRPIAAVLDTAAGLPLAIPQSLVGFGLLFAYATVMTGMIGTKAGLVVGYVILMLPFSVRYQTATLISLGRSTLEASTVSGAGPFRTFFKVILPLSRTGIASSAAAIFILLIHEFGVSLLLRSPGNTVMSVLLFDRFSGSSYPPTAVLALIMTGITLLGVLATFLIGGSKAMERM